MAYTPSCTCRDSVTSCGSNPCGSNPCGSNTYGSNPCAQNPCGNSTQGTSCGERGGNLLYHAVDGFLKTACRVLNGLDNTLCGCDNTLCGCDNNGRPTDRGCGCQRRTRF